jgi:uncharacterized protein (TIGR02145 family)
MEREEILVDIDGNKYNTAVIGKQVWTTENLRVLHFKNGVEIPKARDRQQSEWGRKRSTVYINTEDGSNYHEYGLLYSSSVIFDANGLAPKGWRIPTIEDWDELVNYLGGHENAGRKLKSEDGWKKNDNQPPAYSYKPKPEFGGTNEYNFSALPSGKMDTGYSKAYDVGMYAWYWAATKKIVGKNTTWFGYINLNYFNGTIKLGVTYIDEYLAVRCIKN